MVPLEGSSVWLGTSPTIAIVSKQNELERKDTDRQVIKHAINSINQSVVISQCYNFVFFEVDSLIHCRSNLQRASVPSIVFEAGRKKEKKRKDKKVY